MWVSALKPPSPTDSKIGAGNWLAQEVEQLNKVEIRNKERYFFITNLNSCFLSNEIQ